MEEETMTSPFSKGEKPHLYNLNYDLQYFVNLDCENKICFDCGGPFPTYVSINNGVFICSNCANNHEKLGYNISYIHKINEPWDPYLLSYAIRGGNSRFKRLCLQYEVPCQSLNENNEEKLNKYIIRLGEYNRLVLRSEVYADEPPKPLYNEVAKQPCNLNIIYFPEFQNYHLYKGEVVVPGKTYSIGGKIWKGTKATAGIMGSAGGLVYKAGKPVVCFLGGAAFKGVKYLGSSLWNHYMGSDKDENIKNNNNISKNNNNYINTNNRNNNVNVNNNFNNNNYGQNQILNGFALVDYSDEDLNQIKTVDLNSPENKGSININYTNNINSNKYNIFSIDNNNNLNNKINISNNNNFNNKFGNLNKHNNIIANDNYLINKDVDYNINKSNDNSSKKINIIGLNNKNSYDGFEIMSQDYNHYNQNKENNSSSNSLENNSFAGMNVQFENTDKEKARQDANNFLLKA